MKISVSRVTSLQEMLMLMRITFLCTAFSEKIAKLRNAYDEMRKLIWKQHAKTYSKGEN
jgi:hypothetical protein